MLLVMCCDTGVGEAAVVAANTSKPSREATTARPDLTAATAVTASSTQQQQTPHSSDLQRQEIPRPLHEAVHEQLDLHSISARIPHEVIRLAVRDACQREVERVVSEHRRWQAERSAAMMHKLRTCHR